MLPTNSLSKKQPWSPADATQNINYIAHSEELSLAWTIHAEERLDDRGLINSDVLCLLKKGMVYENPENATRSGFYKYAIEAVTPNSDPRTLRAIVIPDVGSCGIKIVTVMWKDEK